MCFLLCKHSSHEEPLNCTFFHFFFYPFFFLELSDIQYLSSIFDEVSSQFELIDVFLWYKQWHSWYDKGLLSVSSNGWLSYLLCFLLRKFSENKHNWSWRNWKKMLVAEMAFTSFLCLNLFQDGGFLTPSHKNLMACCGSSLWWCLHYIY